MSEQTKNLLGGNYNPDVLECLANLSNDEVFTPPKVVNQMLDMLPPETWSNPNLKFLDPTCKTGVFLREIAKRLIVGLEEQVPNLQQRLDHIFHNQLYGIAITELTALASRRSLYCSKYANGKYSVSKFDNPDGNIRFMPINHTWENGKCKYCGASASQYQRADDLETHAYEFIHTNNPEEIFGMKFDVIIGNPPYQMSDGGAQASAKPIYNLFVDNADKLSPKYLCMIIPSRWMTGGKGLEEFRDRLIHNRKLKELHDFPNSNDCFAGVEIMGGICYFLIDSDHYGECNIHFHKSSKEETISNRFLADDSDDVYIRDAELVSIKNKVWNDSKEKPLSTIVSTRKPFGLATDFFREQKKYGLPEIIETDKNEKTITVYGLDEHRKRIKKILPFSYPIPRRKYLQYYKVFVPMTGDPRNIGSGNKVQVLSPLFIGRIGEACTETYLVAGQFDTIEEAKNLSGYLKTKFTRALISIRKRTQHATQNVYLYVPMQDFSKPWTDEELYKKYNLSEEEIKFIEDNIAPMEDK